MIRNNFAGDDEITLRISNEASETLANAYACVASGKSENIFGNDRKKLRETASEMRSEFAKRCLACIVSKVYDRKRDTFEVLALQASYESMALLPQDSKFDKARLDLLEKHLKIASNVAVRDEKMRSEACAFRAKALIFAAVPLRDKDETEMLLLERFKAKDVLSHVEDVRIITHHHSNSSLTPHTTTNTTYYYYYYYTGTQGIQHTSQRCKDSTQSFLSCFELCLEYGHTRWCFRCVSSSVSSNLEFVEIQR